MTSLQPFNLQNFLDEHAHATDAELAQALTSSAGQLARDIRATGRLNTAVKTNVSDVVTTADMAAENFVAHALQALRPNDGVLGEEGHVKKGTTGRVWVIDPVDGTWNFASGSDYFCSALALVHGDPHNPDELILGSVHRPVTGDSWFAEKNQRTTHNGKELPILADKPLTKSAFATYLHPTYLARDAVRQAWLSVATKAATLRMLGAGSVDLAGIAEGIHGVWMQHYVKVWDWLPGKALIDGVGGTTITTCVAGGVEWSVAGNTQAVADVTAILRNYST